MNYKIWILGFLIVPIYVCAQVKIGGDPTTIGASSLLELESADKALVLTRVTDTSAITNPVNGMLIYDNSQNCIVSYINGSWSGCQQFTPAAGEVDTLCGTATTFSAPFYTALGSNVTATVSYTSSGGGVYDSQLVASTGVTGLAASLDPGSFIVGSSTVTYTITGTPSGAGTATFNITLGGKACIFAITVVDDAIAAELSGTSLTNYNAASDGSWVAVTKTEYDNIAANLSSVTRFGTAESNMLTGPFNSFAGNTMYTYGHSNNPSPNNSYIFAFKVASGASINGNNDLVRLSTSSGGTGFNAYGTALPSNSPISSQQHFVLKGANTLHGVPMYLGLSTDSNNPLYYGATGTTGSYRSGSVTNPNSAFAYGWSMQGLSTTTIQWP